MARWIDLSRIFEPGMPAFPGDTPPEITKKTDLNREGYNTFQVTTGMHVGTHIDAPLHMIEKGKYLSEIAVERFMGNGRFVDARGESKITSKQLAGLDLCKGDVVLVCTGYDQHFGDPQRYFGTYPEMTADFADALAEAEIGILGMDSASPDRQPPFVVHKTLLAREILIIENLVNLDALAGNKKFEVIALPAKFRCAGAPVRVVAKILE